MFHPKIQKAISKQSTSAIGLHPALHYLESIKFRMAFHKYLSYNDVTPKPEYDEDGNEIPYPLRPIDYAQPMPFRLIRPCISVRLQDQLRAVIPLARLMQWRKAVTHPL